MTAPSAAPDLRAESILAANRGRTMEVAHFAETRGDRGRGRDT
jgi:hypothetical protein